VLALCGTTSDSEKGVGGWGEVEEEQLNTVDTVKGETAQLLIVVGTCGVTKKE
jgi:hypothetical protein